MYNRYLPLFPTEFLQSARLRLIATPLACNGCRTHVSHFPYGIISQYYTGRRKKKFSVKFRVILVFSILLNLIMTTKLPYHTPSLMERKIN